MIKAFAFICAVYLATNLWHWRTPVALPLLLIDRTIPFLDWSIGLYFSHFLFLFLVLRRLNNPLNMNRVLSAMVMAALLAATVFLSLPTTVSFGEIFIPGPRMRLWFDLVSTLNTPANAFPSLHMALALLAATAFYDEQTALLPLALLWAAAIGLSTLTAKQHYFVDVLAGAALALFCRWFVWKFIEFKF